MEKVIVKDRLRNHISYWEDIGANSTILRFLREGYTIPFATNVPPVVLRNNTSALENHEIVTKEILELLGTVFKTIGFNVNEGKCVWEPTQTIIWLGIYVNLEKFYLQITNSRIESIKDTADRLLNALPYTSARKLSKLTGKIISTQIVVGDVANLKTRHLYRAINAAKTWDYKAR